MSYLDLPRLHFGGLFFTNPDTINNQIANYEPDVPLVGPDGGYLPKTTGWNALGVAQLWIEQATVLAAVGPEGPVTGDPVIGARMASPSPKTPLTTPDGKGLYDFAKLVDLDPEQQGRSAVYGLRFALTLPGGGGFSGALSIPELQYMTQRTPEVPGSWGLVGTWMGQIDDVSWSGDLSSSPFLAAFREACSRGVAVKLAVDLHQNVPQAQFTSGNLFLYGRVMGSMGPVRPGDLAQAWPGRLIAQRLRRTSSPAASVSAAESAAVSAAESPAAAEAPRPPRGVTLDDQARAIAATPAAPAGAEGGAASLAAAPPAPEMPSDKWNPVPAQVQEIGGAAWLNADLGNAIWVDATHQGKVYASNGVFLVDDGIVLGLRDPATGVFRPFAHGAVDFGGQYRPIDSIEKTVQVVANSGMVSVPLTAEEAAAAASTPLALQAGGQVVLVEPSDGLLMDLSVRSLRLEQGGTAAFQLLARRFGRPIVGEEPVTWRVHLPDGGEAADLAFSWVAPTDADGIATLRVTATGRSIALPADREPLDSLVYYVDFLDPNGRRIGDGPYYGQPNLSVLLFLAYTAPPDPTWEDDVGPILEAYARLYPGMQDKLDIADEATVLGFAGAVAGRMALPITDPAYMPVTRDLSPAKVRMIVDWLNAQPGGRP